MLNIPTNEDFLAKWNEFFGAMKIAAISRIQGAGAALQKLEAPLDDVISILIEKGTEEHVGREISRLKAEDHGDIMLAALFAEMDYVILLMSLSESGEPGPVSDKTIAAGQTVKDSIESLFDFPIWLKKVLNVLNELLSLVRGGS